MPERDKATRREDSHDNLTGGLLESMATDQERNQTHLNNYNGNDFNTETPVQVPEIDYAEEKRQNECVVERRT